MIFFTNFAILSVTLGLCSSFQLDSLVENVNEDRIVGGQTARPAQFPYQVSLRQQRKVHGTLGWFGHRCGGSIISRRWILSAAHCTQEYHSNASNLAVAVGAHHVENDGQIYLLDRIVNHPAYDELLYRNDISLLRTIDRITFKKGVRTISLRRHFVGAGAEAIVSGWGRIQLNVSNATSTHLQYLHVKTITNADCYNEHTPLFRRYIYNGTLCAFARSGQGTCRGDSGGPLVSNKQLIGVVSWGYLCAFGNPDAYTRVSTFFAWIQQVSDVVSG